MKKINVFIPAAGLGERLRPITDHIPKPLVPVLGKPVLQRVLESISDLPVNSIGINAFYKSNEIVQWINKYSSENEITLFHEDTLLGTGGALKNAVEMLNGETFLVHNSDVISNINLTDLVEYHASSGNIVTLAVHDYSKFNCLKTDEAGHLEDIIKQRESENGLNLKAFTGIAVYNPDFLKFVPAGGSSVVDAWLKAVGAGNKIGTYDVSGCYWSDIGSYDAYASAVFDLLRIEGEVLFVHDSLKSCDDTELMGNVVIEEGCELGMGISLNNSIVLPGSRVGAVGESLLYQNCIIGPDFKIDIDEAVVLGDCIEGGKQLIGSGGSDRKYFRTWNKDGSYVLMECGPDDPDYQRHIEYTAFFLKHGVPVPVLTDSDRLSKKAKFEDAGDISLYSYMKCPHAIRKVDEIYKKAIDGLLVIHTRANGHTDDCPLIRERVFDRGHFRWETDYFLEQFVKGLCGILIDPASALADEFDQLSVIADSFEKCLMHRDYQSQNIMIVNGKTIKIIDYQGARLGPPAYDVVSLLWDPYCRIENNIREVIIHYYIQGVSSFSHHFDDQAFRDSLLPCRLQRHMQALGAFAFLASVKGKEHFLKYVPEGLRLLREDTAEAKSTYPALHDLIQKLHGPEKPCTGLKSFQWLF